MNRLYTLILSSLIAITALAQDKEVAIREMKKDIKYLASDKLEGRETGTPGARLAAEHIALRYSEIGLAPKGDNNTYFQEFSRKPQRNPHATAEENAKIDTSKAILGKNVVGYIDNGAATTVVIGAHYDHLGYGDEGSLHAGEKAIHNGADDNASGTAAIMQIAELLKNKYKNNNYLIIAFSGEEKGLWGSNYFTKNATLPIESVNYMINLDMVGRMKDNKLAINGVGTSPVWNEVLEKAVPPTITVNTSESGVGPSDHTSFYLKDIPVLHFFTGQHEDYHKPTDDFEKLNFQGIATVVDIIVNIIKELDDDGELAFTKTKDENEDTPRFTVTLGVMPDYMFDGKGMRIDGVTNGKPASKAGIKAGDIVVKMGDVEVIDMMSYMKGLGQFNKGDKTKVTVNREGKNKTFKVEF